MPSLQPGIRVVVRQFGESPAEAIEQHIDIEAQMPPDPDELKPTDVIVAVRACAVGWVDLLLTSGQYQHLVKPPFVPGLEMAGEVAWIGEEVNDFAVGDRVVPDGLLTGPRSLGDYQGWGGFASWAVAPAPALVKVPDRLSYEQAVNLLGNYETAYHALVVRARLSRGETILVHGASGSTGLATVELAKHLGATVIATGRSAEKLAEVQRAGADHVLKLSPDEPFRDAVKELTNGRGADVVYDGVGGAISVESLRAIRFGGRYLVIGWASTPDVARGRGGRGAPRVNTLPTNLILMKSLDVLGSPAAISAHRDPELRQERLQAVLDLARSGAITPRAGHGFPLNEIREAMRAKWESRFVGGCVVHPP